MQQAKATSIKDVSKINVPHAFQHDIQNCKICQRGNSLELPKILESTARQKKKKKALDANHASAFVTPGVLSVTGVRLFYTHTQDMPEASEGSRSSGPSNYTEEPVSDDNAALLGSCPPFPRSCCGCSGSHPQHLSPPLPPAPGPL